MQTDSGINSLSIFATGYNLFTWTNYTGQDPKSLFRQNQRNWQQTARQLLLQENIHLV